MGKVYKLSPETVKQLSNIEGKARKITLIFFASLLILHFFITALHYLSGYFFPSIFFASSIALLAILGFSYFRGENHFYNYYSSYQIEISDQSTIFMQMNKSPIEIRRDEISHIQEITPEGEIYIVGTRNHKFIDIYALLLRENPEIREQLIEWKPLERKSITTQKIAGPILVVLCGIMALYCFLSGFIYSDFIVPGFIFFGGSIVGFFKIRRWPVYDPRIHNLLWVVIGLAIISAVLALVDLLFLVYSVVGMYLGLF